MVFVEVGLDDSLAAYNMSSMFNDTNNMLISYVTQASEFIFLDNSFYKY